MFDTVRAAVRQVFPDTSHTSETKPSMSVSKLSTDSTTTTSTPNTELVENVQIERNNNVYEVSEGQRHGIKKDSRFDDRGREEDQHKRHQHNASSSGSYTPDFQRYNEVYSSSRDSKERHCSPPGTRETNNREDHYRAPRESRKIAGRANLVSSKGVDNEPTRETMPRNPCDIDQQDETIRRLTVDNDRLRRDLEFQRLSFESREREFKKQLAWAESQYNKQGREFGQCQTYCEQLQEYIHQIEAASKHHEQKSEEREALLDVRTKELNAAQAFLTMTDSCSGSDVINMVQRLNAEIMQASAFMADLVEDLPEDKVKFVSWEEAIPTGPRNFAGLAIGDALVTFLRQQGPNIRKDTFPFQTAIQALLVRWAHYNVGRFCGGETKNALESLYQRIRQTETQAVSAKWRAITAQTYHPGIAKSIGTYIRPIVFGLLSMAGCHQELQSKETFAVIEESLTTIHKLAMEIKVAIKQGILSCDLDLFIIDEPVGFDPSTMTDGGNNSARTSTEKTLCTIALGLTKSTAIPSQGNPKKYELVEQTLLKAEVVLASALQMSRDAGDEDVKMEE